MFESNLLGQLSLPVLEEVIEICSLLGMSLRVDLLAVLDPASIQGVPHSSNHAMLDRLNPPFRSSASSRSE